jgi:hypothetical protein
MASSRCSRMRRRHVVRRDSRSSMRRGFVQVPERATQRLEDVVQAHDGVGVTVFLHHDDPANASLLHAPDHARQRFVREQHRQPGLRAPGHNHDGVPVPRRRVGVHGRARRQALPDLGRIAGAVERCGRCLTLQSPVRPGGRAPSSNSRLARDRSRVAPGTRGSIRRRASASKVLGSPEPNERRSQE